MTNCDVVIMATEKNLALLATVVAFCKANVGPAAIYVVASSSMQSYIEAISDAEFVDEDTICTDLNYQRVADLIEARVGVRERAGWYFQQFLKMAWSARCRDGCYIVLDADTIILNKIAYEEDGKYCFIPKVEYHEPYFATIERLFRGDIYKKADFSFIAENMIIDRAVMQNSEIRGEHFFEKIINAIGEDDLLRSGFSEFETYGNYIYIKYPERIKIRAVRTMRESMQIIGGHPSPEQLEWAAKDYDVIAIEDCDYHKTLLTLLTAQGWFRKVISMKAAVHVFFSIRRIYRKLLKKEDFKVENY